MATPRRIVENDIYAAIIGYCESLEDQGIYKGNGHHLAQKLSKLVSIGLLPMEQKKIYEAISETPEKSSVIAEKIGTTSAYVSAQLCSIEKKSTLVSYKKHGSKYLWYKT